MANHQGAQRIHRVGVSLMHGLVNDVLQALRWPAITPGELHARAHTEEDLDDPPPVS